MYPVRQIEISETDSGTIARIESDEIAEIDCPTLREAINYLSNWAIGSGSYDKVSICLHCESSVQWDKWTLTAHYTSTNDRNMRYFIAGIYSPVRKSYSFHS